MKKTTKAKSKSSMAARLGVSRSTLYEWKSAGAPIEKGDAAVLEWVMAEAKGTKDSAEMRNAKLAFIRENERRLKLANDIKAGRYADRDKVSDGIAKCVAILFQELDRRFISELPPQIVNMEAPAIAKKCRQQIEALKGQLKSSLAEIAKEKSND